MNDPLSFFPPPSGGPAHGAWGVRFGPLFVAVVYPVACWLLVLLPKQSLLRLFPAWRWPGALRSWQQQGPRTPDAATSPAPQQVLPPVSFLSRSQAWRLGCLAVRVARGVVDTEGAMLKAKNIIASSRPTDEAEEHVQVGADAADGAEGLATPLLAYTATSAGAGRDAELGTEVAVPIPEYQLPLPSEQERLLALLQGECSEGSSGGGAFRAVLDALSGWEQQQAAEPRQTAPRRWGLLRFANVMWAIGIVGVSISVLPVLILVTGPVFEKMGELILFLYFTFMPIYPSLGYLACSYLTLHGVLHAIPSAAPFVALTAAGPAAAIWGYQTYWAVNYPAPWWFEDGFEQQAWWILNGSFIAISFAPLAIATSSSLVGLIAVLGAFWAGPYSGLPKLVTFLASILGLRSPAVDFGMLCVLLSSAAITAGLAVCRLRPPQVRRHVAEIAGPFVVPGLTIVGPIQLGTVGLIYTSSSLYEQSTPLQYLANVTFVVVAVAGTFLGAVSELPMFFASGCTFLALWVLQKVVELVLPYGDWPAVLLLSIALCCCGHFLHQYPRWLATVVSG